MLLVGTKYLYLAAVTANILPFMVGTAATWSSPVIPKLQSDETDESPLGRKITQEEASWIGSLVSMGAIFSFLIFGYFSQKVGRKVLAVLVMIPFIIGYFLAAFTRIIELLYIARVLMGLGTGGMFFSSIIYLGEISEDRNRGLLITSTSCFLVTGMLFSLSLGPFVSIMTFNLILACVASLYIPAFWYFAPESPYFFVQQKEDQKALDALHYLRRQSTKETLKALENIKCNLSSRDEGRFLDIFKTKGNVRGFVYCVILVIFQQFAGINVFYAYMQTIFDAANTSIPPEFCPIIIASMQLVSSILSALFNDKIGRRICLLISATGSALSEIVLGAYFYLHEAGYNTSSINWLPIVSLVIFMLFYKFGVGTIAWPMTSELLPPNLVSQVSLVLSSLFWIVGFIMTRYFAPLSDIIGMAGSFWLFSTCLIIFDFFVFFFIFETKGKSFSEIQTILSK